MTEFLVGAIVVVAVGALLVWFLVRARAMEAEERMARGAARMLTGPIRAWTRPEPEPEPEPQGMPRGTSNCARKWDWLKEQDYPYFWAYEFDEWPETPEADLGSRPYIYP